MVACAVLVFQESKSCIGRLGALEGLIHNAAETTTFAPQGDKRSSRRGDTRQRANEGLYEGAVSKNDEGAVFRLLTDYIPLAGKDDWSRALIRPLSAVLVSEESQLLSKRPPYVRSNICILLDM